MKKPSSGPTSVIHPKKPTMPPNDTLSPVQNLKKSVNSTIAVPSLKIDSPLMRSVRRGETPIELNIATTATGSVALRMDPKSMETFHGQLYGRTYLATAAVRNVPMNTPGHARVKHCHLRRDSRLPLMDIASEKIRGGRNVSRKRCGSMRTHMAIDWWKIGPKSVISKRSSALYRTPTTKPSTNSAQVYGTDGKTRSRQNMVAQPRVRTMNSRSRE